MSDNIIGVEGASPSQYLVQQALHDYQNTIQRLTVSQVRQHEILAVIDTREQNPLDLEKYGIKSERGTLPFGDYSLRWPDLRGALVLAAKEPKMILRRAVGVNGTDLRRKFVPCGATNIKQLCASLICRMLSAMIIGHKSTLIASRAPSPDGWPMESHLLWQSPMIWPCIQLLSF